MGAGPSQIDYKERNFTEQPLEKEEIDVLIKSIPKDDVLSSLNQEDKEMIMNNYPVDDLVQRLEQPEREKIVKAMSIEKMFNLRGDSIFDYYFTNNKSELKSCMTNRIKQNDVPKFMATLEGSPTMELTVQDCREYANSINAPFIGDYNNNTNPKGCFSQVNLAGINKVYYNNTSNEDTDCGAYGVSYCIEKNPTPTPCSDEKFNKMIDTIPGIVNQPIQELLQNKSNEYNILNTEKTSLQGKYDTLNEERKQNLDTLALDSFLANPEMYNKMLKEKISQKTLDIFTKDGDINIDVKETIEFKQFSRYFEMAYESKKSVLPQLVESLKKGSPSGLEQFKTKDFANIIIGIGNLMIIYFFYVYLMMKIILQYNSTDKKKVPNETVYNSFLEFFNELGIEEQQFEYVLKFIAFNTFKKFMDYESNNNAKGLDIFLKDSLKILEEFIGKEYVNSLANFDVFPAEEKTFDYVHANVGKPDMSVSQCDCEDYMKSKGYAFKLIDYKGAPSGCIISKNDKAGLYNKASTEGLCSNESVDCVQKPPDVKNFVTTSLGNPDFSVSEFECEQYAKSIGKELRTDLTNRLGGCSVGYDTPNSRNKIGMVYYGSKSNNNTCGSKFSSYISDCVKKKPKVDHFQKFTVGKPDFSVSQFECEYYAKNNGLPWGGSSKSGNVKGCIKDATPRIWYNPGTNSKTCGQHGITCIQKPWKIEDFSRVSSGQPFANNHSRYINETKCQLYSDLIGADGYKKNSWDNRLKGCSIDSKHGVVYFNTHETGLLGLGNPFETETIKSPTDIGANNWVGRSIAMSEKYAVVGFSGFDEQRGKAYIFEVSTGELKHTIEADDKVKYDNFGWRVAIGGPQGAHVIISAVFAKNNAGLDGAGVLYYFDADTGKQESKITVEDSDVAKYDALGESLDIDDGYKFIAGATGYGSGGAAYIFEVANKNVKKLHKLTVSGTKNFGCSVGISGNFAIVGDKEHSDAKGAVFLFNLSNGNSMSKITADDGIKKDYFGSAIGIDGDYIVVGAMGVDNNKGAAYVYDTSGKQLKLTVKDGKEKDKFGDQHTVSISGKYAIIGTRYYDNNNGAAYIFNVKTGELYKKLVGRNKEMFGGGVSIHGNNAMVGAPWYNGNGKNKTGGIYFYTGESGGGSAECGTGGQECIAKALTTV